MNLIEYIDISENLKYHIDNKIALHENVFRVGSDSYLKLFKEARQNPDVLFSDIDKAIIAETDIGEMGLYEDRQVPLDMPMMEEAGVELNVPKRGGPKKYYVYVKNDKGNVIKVTFGDTTGLTAKINNEKARKSFAARHQCSLQKDRTTAAYWACNLPRYAKSLGLSGGGNYYW